MFDFLKRRQLKREVEALRLEKERATLQRDVAILNNWPLSTGSRGSELYEVLTNGTSVAGPAVNERTAMSVSAVYACVRLIAGAIASLPLPIYRRTPEGRERAEHNLWWLLNEQPHPTLSAAVFWEYLLSSVLLHGDAFVLILRPTLKSADISGFVPIYPRNVQVINTGDRLKYAVWGIGKSPDKPQVVDQDDMLHVPGVGFDGLRSLSPIRHAARQAIGLALAAEEHAARFFSHGANPDVVLEYPGNLNDEQITKMRESWSARYGGLANAHLPVIAAGGLKIHPLSMNAEDAQLMATRQFQVVDIARIYGVPPHMIGETEKTSSWGSGVEHMSIGFVKYTLQPHLTRIEQELNRKCFRTAKYFCEFNTAGLERGDIKTRYEAFRTALGRAGEPGWMSPNEVRRIDNLPPTPGGDRINTGEPNAPDATAAGG